MAKELEKRVKMTALMEKDAFIAMIIGLTLLFISIRLMNSMLEDKKNIKR